MNDELEAIRRAQAGDEHAVLRLLNRYLPIIQVTLQKIKPPGETEDLFQDGVLLLLQQIRDYDPRRGCQFKSRLIGRLRWLYIDTIRKDVRRRKYFNCGDPEPPLGRAVAPQKSFSPELTDLLSLLDDRERQVFDLFRRRPCDMREAARLLGRSPSGVSQVLHRIRSKAKRLYVEEPDVQSP